jgi:archaellum component FlaC
MDDMWKKEIAEMQKNVHTLQLRVKTLTERVNELTNKVTIMGGDPQQLEMEFSDVTR